MGSYSCCSCSPCFNALITTGIVLLSIGIGFSCTCFLAFIGGPMSVVGLICLIVGLVMMCFDNSENEKDDEKMPIYGAKAGTTPSSVTGNSISTMPQQQYPQMHMQQPAYAPAPQVQQPMYPAPVTVQPMAQVQAPVYANQAYPPMKQPMH